jgi:MFS family permease
MVYIGQNATNPHPSAAYLPCATLIFEWYSTRRGLASGIMYAGTGAGGTIFPFIVSALLTRLGYKLAMIILGVGFGVLGSIGLLGIKRRVPIARRDGVGRGRDRRRNEVGTGMSGLKGIDWSWWRRPTFLGGMAIILMTSMGFSIPTLWIPCKLIHICTFRYRQQLDEKG